MNTLDSAYEELITLAAERRARLEESRRLWQFYWDMEDEEGWIREKEHLMSSPDLGHDLTSVHLLLNKHKVMVVIHKLIYCEHIFYYCLVLQELISHCNTALKAKPEM
jgi:hypothetical protein